MKDASTRREEFEYWLSEMDDALARFRERLPESVRASLDYTDASLDVVEAWLLTRFKSPSDLLVAPAKDELDAVARYVGETFRRHLGGHWEIRLDDPKYAYFGIPQLTGFSDRPTPVCPHSLATASTDRRTGSYFSTVLRNTRKRLDR